MSAICADARAALEALTEAAGASRGRRRPWLDRVRGLRSEWQARLGRRRRRTSPMHPAAFFRELREALPRDVLYSWDGGDFAHWGRAILPAREPGGWLRLGPLGTIGSSLPNASGAATGASRDGRWRPSPATARWASTSRRWIRAVRHKLPIVLIVGNDARLGPGARVAIVRDRGARDGGLRAAGRRATTS